MNVPGHLKVGHHFITDNCREIHGDSGALDEAFKRLRKQYLQCLPHWPKGTKFHLMMTIEEAPKDNVES